MSGSDRSGVDKALIGIILAVIVGVAFYWAMFYDAGYRSGQYERKANVEAQHYARDSAEQIERKCGAETGETARECIAQIVKAERESQRSEGDLAAQWKAADWAFWAAVVSAAQLLVTVVGIYFLKGTLDATWRAVHDTGLATVAMREANEIAREAQRPWLKLTVNPEMRFFPGEGDSLHRLLIDATAENFGSSPAVNVTLHVSLLRGRSFHVPSEIERIAKVGRHKGPFGVAVYPKEAQPIEPDTAFGVAPLDMPSGQDHPMIRTAHYVGIALFYRSPTALTTFYTAAFFHLWRADLPKEESTIHGHAMSGVHHGQVTPDEKGQA